MKCETEYTTFAGFFLYCSLSMFGTYWSVILSKCVCDIIKLEWNSMLIYIYIFIIKHIIYFLKEMFYFFLFCLNLYIPLI